MSVHRSIWTIPGATVATDGGESAATDWQLTGDLVAGSGTHHQGGGSPDDQNDMYILLNCWPTTIDCFMRFIHSWQAAAKPSRSKPWATAKS